jgi:hypothetical protein
MTHRPDTKDITRQIVYLLTDKLVNRFSKLYTKTKDDNQVHKFILKEFQVSIKNHAQNVPICFAEDTGRTFEALCKNLAQSPQKVYKSCFIEVARSLWKQPQLFYHGLPVAECQANMRACEKLVRRCIKDALAMQSLHEEEVVVGTEEAEDSEDERVVDDEVAEVAEVAAEAAAEAAEAAEVREAAAVAEVAEVEEAEAEVAEVAEAEAAAAVDPVEVKEDSEETEVAGDPVEAEKDSEETEVAVDPVEVKEDDSEETEVAVDPVEAEEDSAEETEVAVDPVEVMRVEEVESEEAVGMDHIIDVPDDGAQLDSETEADYAEAVEVIKEDASATPHNSLSLRPKPINDAWDTKSIDIDRDADILRKFVSDTASSSGADNSNEFF